MKNSKTVLKGHLFGQTDCRWLRMSLVVILIPIAGVHPSPRAAITKMLL